MEVVPVPLSVLLVRWLAVWVWMWVWVWVRVWAWGGKRSGTDTSRPARCSVRERRKVGYVICSVGHRFSPARCVRLFLMARQDAV